MCTWAVAVSEQTTVVREVNLPCTTTQRIATFIMLAELVLEWYLMLIIRQTATYSDRWDDDACD